MIPTIVGQFIEALTKRTTPGFARVTYRAKETNELARHMLILNASTENLYTKDVDDLNVLLRDEVMQQEIANQATADFGKAISPEMVCAAALKVKASLIESLSVGIGNNSAYTNADTYVYLPHVQGVRVHKETGVLYVMGYSQDKVVLEAGEYKTVNSKPETLARKAVERLLRKSKIRTFIIAPENLKAARLNGEVIEVETV